ncbi:hypothetical protein VNO78_08941 [Psophocarpus tetragonolobus]|uniref:Uncharacterized protein n=1 Tax=Psophocarpus tetragonolobus TaxID=3891 RepID=A0AAN9SVR7_PSOTE
MRTNCVPELQDSNNNDTIFVSLFVSLSPETFSLKSFCISPSGLGPLGSGTLRTLQTEDTFHSYHIPLQINKIRLFLAENVITLSYSYMLSLLPPNKTKPHHSAATTVLVVTLSSAKSAFHYYHFRFNQPPPQLCSLQQ